MKCASSGIGRLSSVDSRPHRRVGANGGDEEHAPSPMPSPSTVQLVVRSDQRCCLSSSAVLMKHILIKTHAGMYFFVRRSSAYRMIEYMVFWWSEHSIVEVQSECLPMRINQDWVWSNWVHGDSFKRFPFISCFGDIDIKNIMISLCLGNLRLRRERRPASGGNSRSAKISRWIDFGWAPLRGGCPEAQPSHGVRPEA